jgi:hypothetical protein
MHTIALRSFTTLGRAYAIPDVLCAALCCVLPPPPFPAQVCEEARAAVASALPPELVGTDSVSSSM